MRVTATFSSPGDNRGVDVAMIAPDPFALARLSRSVRVTGLPFNRTDRRYTPSSTDSSDGTVRAARNPSTQLKSKPRGSGIRVGRAVVAVIPQSRTARQPGSCHSERAEMEARRELVPPTRSAAARRSPTKAAAATSRPPRTSRARRDARNHPRVRPRPRAITASLMDLLQTRARRRRRNDRGAVRLQRAPLA